MSRRVLRALFALSSRRTKQIEFSDSLEMFSTAITVFVGVFLMNRQQLSEFVRNKLNKET